MVMAAKAGLQCLGRRLSRISIEVTNGVLAFKILRYTCVMRMAPTGRLGEVCADSKSYETVDTGFVKANKLLISIEMLSATPFEDPLVGSEVSEAFVIRFTGPLGGTGRRKHHVTFTASREQAAAAEAGPRMRLWIVAAGYRINRGMSYLARFAWAILRRNLALPSPSGTKPRKGGRSRLKTANNGSMVRLDGQAQNRALKPVRPPSYRSADGPRRRGEGTPKQMRSP